MQSEPVITTLEPLPPICKEDGFISSQRLPDWWHIETYSEDRPFPAPYKGDKIVSVSYTYVENSTEDTVSP
ncbi:hypothetical protein BQ9231_00564 [Cedratvirus lausannensis]|uniref:Uncharacterized protein n=1 Tax=Cedratvirus lausannensis TaxID=2023205 RepID=A0A285PYX8_9VIRU|nr:hypothetical protein BQ9231_00564 [Cedratvirus lausannensis]